MKFKELYYLVKENINNNKIISYQEFEDQLEKQNTLDLEDDQVQIPSFNKNKDHYIDTLIVGEAHLMLRNGEDIRSYGPHEFFIVDNDDVVIGFVRLTKNPSEISINLIYINDDYRGRGIATEFYKFWLDKGISIKSDKEISSGTEAVYTSLVRQGYNFDIKDDRAILKPKS
jgi:predicted GNAT family acetyltransferase